MALRWLACSVWVSTWSPAARSSSIAACTRARALSRWSRKVFLPHARRDGLVPPIHAPFARPKLSARTHAVKELRSALVEPYFCTSALHSSIASFAARRAAGNEGGRTTCWPAPSSCSAKALASCPTFSRAGLLARYSSTILLKAMQENCANAMSLSPVMAIRSTPCRRRNETKAREDGRPEQAAVEVGEPLNGVKCRAQYRIPHLRGATGRSAGLPSK